MQADDNTTQILDLLTDNLSDHNVPKFVFMNMVSAIENDPPADAEKLQELIGEDLQKELKISGQKLEDLCADILDQLNEKGLIESSLFKKSRQNTEISNKASSKLQKAQKKADSKRKEIFERHLQEMEGNKRRLPPTEVRHEKDPNRSTEFLIESLSLMVGGKTLLDNARLQLVHGRKYGLVGKNGIGKTQLLTALARGDIEKMATHLQILLVEQEVEADGKTVLETVLETDVERHNLLKEEQALLKKKDEESQKRLVEIYKRLEHIHAFSQEAKASKILSGLGFTADMQKMTNKELSGGWRMRVSLARALFVEPDILLLDEPTNHLDLEAVMWLEDYICESENTVVVVSHDREFLNVVCTDMMHFIDQELVYYKGNYDTLEKTRNALITQTAKIVEKQQDKIQHTQQFIDKFRANAKRASLVQSRIKALQKMDIVEEITEETADYFYFPVPEKIPPPVLHIDDGVFGYTPNKIILKKINLNVDMDSRVAIVGANGAGKSTFLKLLMGELTLLEGKQYRHSKLRISMFTQHHIDQLDLMLTPVEQLQQLFPGSTVEQYRRHLASFGLQGQTQIQSQYLLSGGQKSRVAFAIAVWKHPHILILDEPTNHLDILGVNALIEALNNFQGGVLIVSHDQHLVASVCDDIRYIKNGVLKKYKGDFADYRADLASGSL